MATPAQACERQWLSPGQLRALASAAQFLILNTQTVIRHVPGLEQIVKALDDLYGGLSASVTPNLTQDQVCAALRIAEDGYHTALRVATPALKRDTLTPAYANYAASTTAAGLTVGTHTVVRLLWAVGAAVLGFGMVYGYRQLRGGRVLAGVQPPTPEELRMFDHENVRRAIEAYQDRTGATLYEAYEAFKYARAAGKWLTTTPTKRHWMDVAWEKKDPLGIAKPKSGKWPAKDVYRPIAFDVLQQRYACSLQPARKHKKLLGISRLPAHVAEFGNFMLRMSQRETTPQDVTRAYLITVSSIHRVAMSADKLRQYWPTHPFTSEKVRPEDAFAKLLSSTPEGYRYVRAAAAGRYDATAAQDLVKRFWGYGNRESLGRALREAPALAAKATEVNHVIKTGSRRKWMEFVAKNAYGVSYAKSGFLGSILGRGDIATADAREMGLWNPELAQKTEVTREYVDVLNKRLRQLDVELPADLRPFYEHLVHHTIWDRLGGSEVYHNEIKECMESET